MRYAMAVTLLVAGLGWHSGSAAQDFVDVVVPYSVAPDGVVGLNVTCPDGYEPLYPVFPNTDPEDIEISSSPVGPSLATPTAPSGYFVKVKNRDIFTYRGVLILRCARPIGQILRNQTTRTVLPGQTVVVAGTCPAGLTTIGVAANADGINLQERFRVFLFTVPNTPGLVPLNAMPDGIHPAPTRTDIGVRNNTPAPIDLDAEIKCLQLPVGAQTLIVSSPVVDGQQHAVFAPVPDGWVGVANSFTVNNSVKNNVTLWDDTGQVTGLERLPVGNMTWSLRPRGLYLEGVGAPPTSAKQQVVGRAVVGTIVIPSTTPVPLPTIVTIVEFYHAGLDHYFITAIGKEISDLDAGVHAGWQRTGESFNAYGVGSSGRTGRRPVCRAYGNPAAGLDSHFYSASPQECRATLDNFGDDWLLEASEVFELELPDTTTGACAADRVPIYRLWNGRADSSHRFVKTLALRAQMIARGFVSEGYGPNGVVFCALP